MTTEQPEPISFKNFSNSILPWIVLGSAVILYVVTLNHFVTLGSLSTMAKVTGWDWQKPLAAPLYYLLTLPLHWFPTSWQVLGANLLSAICATLTLGLLARSVALLPQDRTKEQRSREYHEFSLLSIRRAWIPPVLAVLLCAFQLTFWENATIASGEILDVLVFAYVIRCLLEYRLTENETWLKKFALVYGLGMANNWAMVGYFPCFLIALVWIRGFTFFNWRFIGRIAAFGAVGLLLYLLLPLVNVLSGSENGFWDVLKTNLVHQKNLTLNSPFIGGLKFDFLAIALTSLLPILVVGTRWTADFADISPTGTMLTNFMFRVLHLTLLVFCVWVFFDYKFSPRILGRGIIPFLTFYYLSALSAGYLCGYVLLVFGHEGERAWGKSRSSLKRFNKAIAFIVSVAAIGVPFWLFYRSLPSIREVNGPALREFAVRMDKSLPKNAAVFSDDFTRLYLMQALEATKAQKSDRLFVHTRYLPNQKYHDYLRERYPSGRDLFVTAKLPKQEIPPLALIQMAEGLRQTHPLYYLQSSFGYYFERYYPRQHGLVYELVPFASNEFTLPKLDEAQIEENEAFWNAIPAPSLKKLTVMAETFQDASVLCSFYSSALNVWGVELQRNQQLKAAEEKFLVAWTLDPNNVVAQINGRYNVSLQRGDARPVGADEGLLKQIGYLHGLVGAMSYFGPMDEPSARLWLGKVFKDGGNLRQAAQQYSRIIELLPNDPQVRISFAHVLLDLNQPEQALNEVREVRKRNEDQLPAYEFDLVDVEARALLLKNNFASAEDLMMQTLERDLKDEGRYRLVYQFYVSAAELIKPQQPALAQERYKKGIGILDQLIAMRPDAWYLLNKAVLCFNIGDLEESLSVLNRILETDPANTSALINRAIIELQKGQFDGAKKDYLEYIKLGSAADQHRAYFGLAEIAERTKDAAAAIKNYKAYLEIAPRNSAEYEKVAERLKILQGGKTS
ncbi:MAG: Tetratricopeptide repeat protein [Verrucomicrobiales bacterium]|nr:Tetratricopeptide repeat protein [Verrucomicrobiales bacterium]